LPAPIALWVPKLRAQFRQLPKFQRLESAAGFPALKEGWGDAWGEVCAFDATVNLELNQELGQPEFAIAEIIHSDEQALNEPEKMGGLVWLGLG
jgi:hypothetical protein